MFRRFVMSAFLAAAAGVTMTGIDAAESPIFDSASPKGHGWAGRRRKRKGYIVDAQRRGRR
jgi:hypothetical protein